MSNNRILLLTMAIFVGLVCKTASANEVQVAKFEQHMSETKDRLKLTDEQAKKISPALESSFNSAQTILDKYGVSHENAGNGKKLGLRKVRKMAKELEVVRANTLKEVCDVLTSEQLTEYQKIQAERRAAIQRKILESRRESSAP